MPADPANCPHQPAEAGNAHLQAFAFNKAASRPDAEASVGQVSKSALDGRAIRAGNAARLVGTQPSCARREGLDQLTACGVGQTPLKITLRAVRHGPNGDPGRKTLQRA